MASNPEFLGLLAMRRERGFDWHAADDEIEAFLAAFYPEPAEDETSRRNR